MRSRQVPRLARLQPPARPTLQVRAPFHLHLSDQLRQAQYGRPSGLFRLLRFALYLQSFLPLTSWRPQQASICPRPVRITNRTGGDALWQPFQPLPIGLLHCLPPNPCCPIPGTQSLFKPCGPVFPCCIIPPQPQPDTPNSHHSRFSTAAFKETIYESAA